MIKRSIKNRIYMQEYYRKNKKKMDRDSVIRNKMPKYRYRTYKRNAKRKELAFNLSFSKFIALIKQSCYYCGTEDSHGMDRIDNKFGYSVKNIVPCCTMCNMMKNKHSLDEFIGKCNKIVLNNNNKNE